MAAERELGIQERREQGYKEKLMTCDEGHICSAANASCSPTS